MIGVDALLDLILADLEPLPRRVTGILSATGAVLAEDLVVVDPLPPFANSAMDGFAVRRADLDERTGRVLRLVDDLPAGRVTERTLRPGETASIATGGMVPRGADAVVPLEQATLAGDRLTVDGDVPAHGHIRPAGEDVARGGVLARAGDLVTRRLITLAAAAGVAAATVVHRPRVGVLATGDELVALDAPLAPGKVRDVNGLLLLTAIEALGMMAVDLGMAEDDPQAIAGRLTGLTDVDAVVVCGGLGRARRDVVVETIARIGTVRAFEVAMRPGKPFAFGEIGGRPIFGLPGNPVAAVVAFHVLVAPALRRLAGRAPAPRPVARLTEAFENRGGRRHFPRVRLHWSEGGLMATSVGGRGSGAISSLVAADGLLEIHESIDSARAGESYCVIPFEPREGW